VAASHQSTSQQYNNLLLGAELKPIASALAPARASSLYTMTQQVIWHGSTVLCDHWHKAVSLCHKAATLTLSRDTTQSSSERGKLSDDGDGGFCSFPELVG
jgi:hypothetical protein